ncbi:MAG TPA: SGNH/GDSL hydrolase family protein [Terriglobales bacterium]|nr:SGNH/GDSL hydrolase family protein [Terriglobales bacterium]
MKSIKIIGVFVITVLIAVGSATAKDRASGSGNFLALGDSVPFGFIDQAGFEYLYPENFVSYADYDSILLGLNLVNASCPGETTSSFLSAVAPDNGCHEYRRQAPLHVVYTSFNGTQFAYATGYLRQNLDTSLVTLMLGADDLLLLEQQCNNDPTCIRNGAPQVLATAEANMSHILAGLRATGYTGPIVIVNYYSTDYSNQFETELIQALNAAVTAPASQFGAAVADVFSAFQAATNNPFAMGNTCMAGLLNAANPQTNPPTCDVHPSQFGHKLIASVISGLDQQRQAPAKQ